MSKTIKEIADELGVSKTAVRKKIANLGLQSGLRKNGNQFAIEKEQEILIKSAFHENQSETSLQSETKIGLQSQTKNNAVIDVLVKQSETLKNELEIKNKQIEELNKRLEESQKLLDQQQKLHAMAEQKIQLLEHKETSKTDNKDQTEEINQLKEQLDREKKEQLNEIEKLKIELEKEKNKGFFARLFSK
jgi:DNA repair exonuclease SbcCD ATPase subunit